jgi:RNA polymerase sigma-70 factor, ECF subfamily
MGDRDAARELRVVVDDHDSVRGGVDVELDAVGARRERRREGGQGVLALVARHSPMRDPERREGHRQGIEWRANRWQRYVTDRNGHGKTGLNTEIRPASNEVDRMTDVAPTTNERTDLDLVERWKAGEQRAATQLVERHASAVARFVASIGVRSDADDVVQDTFVRAFAAIDGFRGESAFRTWLFTIARRLVLDRRRSARRRGEAVEVREEDAATEFDALDGVVADEMQTRLMRAMEALTPTQREVFVLRVNEGMSYREIAQTVDTTEGAARVHYHNAMRAIKEFLDD